ncbi:DUF2851 family protein [Thermoflexibacter ruber]|uniref:DUF2851 domain-containing protein n=1 Tax=Thermoflexibacter ruber TaxID=1003 RepID=A0A1I2IG34_9BACT|nr:DUF2851 family protein [Thermoflexibacter ruber]SFF41275.1 Protein of unknown function [Thermoflexibacter ruber]
MQEFFIHYLWQFQYFDKKQLQTTAKEDLEVIAVGHANPNAGADFTQACVVINGIKWYGNVEIHLKTSDWLLHQHHENKAYDNVILHVAWEDDLNDAQKIKRKDGSSISTLTLKERVDKLLVEKYYLLISNKQDTIPCAPQIPNVKPITKISMLDKALIQRLQRKAKEVIALLDSNRGDWETTAYLWTAQSFGFKVNNEAFLRLAKALPYSIVAKYTENLLALEALIFGQAGFLSDKAESSDAYFDKLAKEYAYLSHKHKLQASGLAKHEWKFLRLRPANFPTIRLAQFAQLLHKKKSLFNAFTQTENFEQLYQFLDIQQSAYWQKHYTFGKESQGKIVGLGKQSIANLIINTVVPLLVAYSNQKDNQLFTDRAIYFLEQIQAEKNHILSAWEKLGIKAQNAFDSQALIELYNHYCSEKRCLQCNIGISLLK